MIRAVQWVFAPHIYSKIKWFRSGLALVFALYLREYLRHGDEWLTSRGFHVAPEENYFPFLEQWMLWWFAALLYGAVSMVVLNIFPRVFCAVLFAISVYVLDVDVLTSFTINRFFAAWFLILACSPSPQLVQGELLISGWPVRLFQITLVSQYFWCGVQKYWCGGDWKAPDTFYSLLRGSFRTTPAAMMLRSIPPWGFYCAQLVTVLYELLSPLLFVLPWPHKMWAIGTGLAFHFLVALTYHMLEYFSVQCCLVYLMWMPDEFFERPVLESIALVLDWFLETKNLIMCEVFTDIPMTLQNGDEGDEEQEADDEEQDCKVEKGVDKKECENGKCEETSDRSPTSEQGAGF